MLYLTLSGEMLSSMSYSKVVLIKRFKKKTHLIFLEFALNTPGSCCPFDGHPSGGRGLAADDMHL